MDMIVDQPRNRCSRALHENPIAMTENQEEDVLVKSVELIEKLCSKKPTGYGTVVGNVNSTAALLLKHGFSYDHNKVMRFSTILC